MKHRIECVTFEGIDIYYRISGNGNDYPLLLIHGLAGDSRFFHNQLKYFGISRTTIAIDLPGHGKSRIDGNISIELYNRAIEKIIEQEQLTDYMMAGHSMGGVLCLYHYFRHKTKVRALILISTSYVLPIEKTLIDASSNNFYKLIDEIIPKIFQKKTGMFLLAARKNFEITDQKTVTNDLLLCSNVNFENQMKEIDIPVLVLANRFDRMVPVEFSIMMHLKIIKSELIIFEEHGHVPFYENSDKFNNAVIKFIEQIQ